MEELIPQFVCDNPKVKKLKDDFLKEMFDIVNSLEHNSEQTNLDCWEGLFKMFKGIQEAINSVEEANKGRERFNLKQLTEQRNKLNRQISTLKKALPKKEQGEKCYCCEEYGAEEYNHATINQSWAGQNLQGNVMCEESCWLCKDCIKDENDYDSQC